MLRLETIQVNVTTEFDAHGNWSAKQWWRADAGGSPSSKQND
ncbi:hypothetical protein D082_24580 [Synechocystis sp. PCC 6714]|nr:hypothetical protein D082_24580 [Synechocystis sp. PCC 6714]